MKHILLMETGSFKVIGGAAKDIYKIYSALRKRKDYHVDVLADLSKIDKSVKGITTKKFMSTYYDLIWLNSIRDVELADAYKHAHPEYNTKFMYIDRGNVLLNFENAKLKKFLPKMLVRRYLMSKMEIWLDYYIAISSDQYEYAKSFFRHRTHVKYIMIAPHDEYKILNMKKTFSGAITVSRLDERQKKLSFMIRGIAEIKKKHKDIGDKEILRIVGTGIDEMNYKRLAKALGVEENINFMGFITGERLIKTYNNASFYVSTSEWEGLGRSLLEAMACGLPLLINNNINTIISTRPVKRLVNDGINGSVYRYGDIDGFSERFYKLYANRKLQKKLADNAKRLVGQFSFDKVVKSYENIIDSLWT